jgi:glycerophosphoryl diester phosphodiesterase
MSQTSLEPSVTRLLVAQHERGDDWALAARHAPLLLCDRNDPFAPTATGYGVHRAEGRSASGRKVRMALPDGAAAAAVVEYVVWWDWSISALGALQHVLVYVDAGGKALAIEAGNGWVCPAPAAADSSAPRLLVYCEPVRHALAAQRHDFSSRDGAVRRACDRNAGRDGVRLVSNDDAIAAVKTPQADRLAHTYLARHAFQPSFELDKAHAIDGDELVPWRVLAEWIPRRMAWWIGQLDRRIAPAERRFLRIAHRGASAHAPENTLAAFVKAAELGADMVELDLHNSEDGTPVVIHDPDLERTTNGMGFVYAQRIEALKQLDAGGGERIPTLDEAVNCCRAHDLGMYLELKNELAAHAVAAVVRAQDLYDRVIVASFRTDWLAELRALDPRIATAALFSSTHVDPIPLAAAVGAAYVHPGWEYRAAEPHRLLTPEWIRRVHAARLGIVSWHEERPSEIAILRRLGLEGICSNAPELLL